MLVIKDLSKLKIKRITDYKIYFDYDEESYFIKETIDEYAHILLLYKRKTINKNIIDVECIKEAGFACTSDIYDVVYDIRHKAYPFKNARDNLVYKFIDKEKFVEILQSCKLVEYNKQQ